MMNKSKHGKSRLHKSILLVVSAVSLFVCVVSASLAYLTATTTSITNRFEVAQVDISVLEPGWNNGDSVKENVQIQNNGSVAVNIRAMIVVTWQTVGEDGVISVYPKAPVAGVDYQISIPSDTGWSVPDASGWYTYKSEVASNHSTGVLIESCTPVDANTPEGYHLVVDVIAEAIQAEGIPEDNHPWFLNEVNEEG